MASLLTLPESTVRVIQITWIQGSRYPVIRPLCAAITD
jgi:hypothetical protein